MELSLVKGKWECSDVNLSKSVYQWCAMPAEAEARLAERGRTPPARPSLCLQNGLPSASFLMQLPSAPLLSPSPLILVT